MNADLNAVLTKEERELREYLVQHETDPTVSITESQSEVIVNAFDRLAALAASQPAKAEQPFTIGDGVRLKDEPITTGIVVEVGPGECRVAFVNTAAVTYQRVRFGLLEKLRGCEEQPAAPSPEVKGWKGFFGKEYQYVWLNEKMWVKIKGIWVEARWTPEQLAAYNCPELTPAERDTALAELRAQVPGIV